MASHFQTLTRAAFGPCTSLSKNSKKDKSKIHKKSTSQNKDTHILIKDAYDLNKNTHKLQDDRNNAGGHDGVGSHEKIPEIKKQLHPLLDAIIAVESDKMNEKVDFKGGTRIGVLQIDEQYYRDAWGPNGSSYHWSQSRDIEHAENTVVAYWLRHCPDAVANNDWETLARIHNGGPEGLTAGSTKHYWTKICKWLKQKSLQAPSVFGPHKNGIHTTVPEQNMTTFSKRPTLADINNLLPFNRNATQTQKRQNGRQVWHNKTFNKSGIEDDVKNSCATSILRRVQRSSSNGANHSYPRHRSQFSLPYSPFISEPTESSSVSIKRRHSIDFSSSNDMLKLWSFSCSLRRERAAIVVQAYTRMFLTRSQYKRIKFAVLKIQRWWRQYGNIKILFSDYNTIQRTKNVFQEQFSYHSNQASIFFSQVQDEKEALQSNVDLLQSPADLLYKGNISASEEEKILTELADLLLPSDDNGLEQFNHSESGMPDEEPGNFHFPLLQEGGESEKSTPVLTRVHSPRRKSNCISDELDGFGELENCLPEWLEMRKLDFVKMEVGTTNFVSVQMDETFPEFVDIISERRQVSSSAKCPHFGNRSDYRTDEYHSKKIKSGLGHSQYKKFCLDESPNASSHNGTNEENKENTGEIWARNISLMERRGKAGLLHRNILGSLEVESKVSKLAPENNPPKLIGLDFQKGFPRKKATWKAHRVILDDENISEEIGEDPGFVGLMGSVSTLELSEHGNNSMAVEHHDPPLSVAAMFCCLFPEASFTTSAVALLCSDVHSRKQKVCSSIESRK